MSKNIIDGGLVVLALGAGILANLDGGSTSKPSLSNKYKHIYMRSYIANGQCLSDTIYDPATGASVSLHYDKQAHEDILSVTPSNTQEKTLHFTAGKDKINFADSYTGSLLVRASCSVPSGS